MNDITAFRFPDVLPWRKDGYGQGGWYGLADWRFVLSV